jgi:hypothetical protein
MDDRERYLRQADLAPAGYYPGGRSGAWLESQPGPVIGLNRPMNIPKQYSRSRPPSEREFDKIHSRNGGNDAA